MAGRCLYLGTTTPPTRIDLDEIDNILLTDASYKKTPGWAIALGIIGILVFLLGIFFFFVKETVPQTQVTIYRKGSPTPITTFRAADVGTTQTEWYPVIRMVG